MIVTCEECSTSFQLDESRIPATGARVRCSRCKHAFFLPSPTAKDTDAVHAIAEEAAQDPTPGTPSSASELAGSADLGIGFDDAGDPASAAAEGEEEDWEFTEEIKVEADEDADLGAGSDFGEGFDADALSAETADGDFGVGDDPSNGLDVNALASDATSSGLELDIDEGDGGATDVGIEAGHDDSSFGTVDDFSTLDDETAEKESATIERASSAPVDVDPPADESAVGTYSQVGPAEEIEDPENWDLAPDADFSSDSKALGGLVDSFRGGSTAATTEAAEDTPDYFEDEFEETSPLFSGLVQGFHALGWIATATAVVVVAYLGFQAERSRFEPTPHTLVAGAFVAETTGSGWVETLRSGNVLVVNGTTRNTGTRALPAPNMAILALDGQGMQVGSVPYLVGHPIAEEVLREADPATLERALNRAHSEFRQTPIRPGASQSFQAVIPELPTGATRVALEIVPEAPPAAQVIAPAPPALAEATSIEAGGDAGVPVESVESVE